MVVRTFPRDDRAVSRPGPGRRVGPPTGELGAEHDVKIETVGTVGRSARVIVNHATDYDAIVMGSHSGSVADRLFIGNVAKTVFRRSPIPMTVVRWGIRFRSRSYSDPPAN